MLTTPLTQLKKTFWELDDIMETAVEPLIVNIHTDSNDDDLTDTSHL